MYKLFFTLSFVILQLVSPAQRIPMQAGHWDSDSFKTDFQTIDGRETMTLKRGTVWAKDVLFGDGIIEVDISVSPKKSLTGISFRGDRDETCENIYLRVPLSGRDDAIQYAPFFHNEDYWQLYPEHQAKYVYPETGWVHMKIIVQGNTARLFINTDSLPALVVNNLRTRNRSGKIGLWCLSEQSFSNFSYTPLPASAFTAIPVREETGLVRTYQLSQVFTIDKKTKTLTYPTDQSLRWDTVVTEEDGLLNIGKYRFKQSSGTFEQNSNDLVWIKMDLTSAAALTKKMNLDFTNRIWVFLNGQIIYHGDHSYRLKGPFYKGLIDKSFIADALFLPLQKGKNELMIGISSVANGWGLISKIE